VRFSKHGSVVETRYMIFCSRHYIVPVSCKTFTEGTTERLNSVSCNWKKSLTVKVTRFKVTVELDISVKSVAIELSISWECCNCLYSVCLFVFWPFECCRKILHRDLKTRYCCNKLFMNYYWHYEIVFVTFIVIVNKCVIDIAEKTFLHKYC